jgi:hypothetical protein
MPELSPVSRGEFIARLRTFGYEGPFSGGKHQYMVRRERRIAVPNPHRGGISVGLLRRTSPGGRIDGAVGGEFAVLTGPRREPYLVSHN